ncbi:MAG TPA: ATP-binding cassette domain-containing protein [Gammaproteobacteria bacterium]|nr:ATP-binding cassette domain-containing protein [Gammaproteobacteria bacterium]
MPAALLGTGTEPRMPHTEEAAPLVAAEAAVLGYDRPVLGPLSFELHAGEVLGLWGPNGAGKSTVLKAIAGSARVHQGRLALYPGLRIAYQSQRPVRLAEMPLTGGEFLDFAGGTHAAVPERLRPWLDRRVDRLSGGQFQLLNIWACLAAGADLVLLDEPSNNLDPEGVALLADLLGHPEGHGAVLLVSHEAPFLERVATRRLEVGV